MTKLKLWEKSCCDSSDSSDQKKTFPQKNSFCIFFTIFFHLFFFTKNKFHQKTQTVMKLKNSNCDQTLGSVLRFSRCFLDPFPKYAQVNSTNCLTYPEFTLWPWNHTKSQRFEYHEIKLSSYPDFKPKPWNQTKTMKSD